MHEAQIRRRVHRAGVPRGLTPEMILFGNRDVIKRKRLGRSCLLASVTMGVSRLSIVGSRQTAFAGTMFVSSVGRAAAAVRREVRLGHVGLDVLWGELPRRGIHLARLQEGH